MAGKGLSGESFADLAVFMRTAVQGRHPVHVVLQSTCRCRETVFLLSVDPEEGCACRTCVACGADALIGDSGERWEQAEAAPVTCRCGGDHLELGVGFSFRPDNEVKWITVGRRCARCGRMECAADWDVDARDTEHLLERT